MSSGEICFVLMDTRKPFGPLSSRTACSCVLLNESGRVISDPCAGCSNVHLLLSLHTLQVLRCLCASLHFVHDGWVSPAHICSLQLSQTRHSSHRLRRPNVRTSPSEIMNARAPRHLSSPC